jgi:ATP-dependent protease HslVU (ClpYQ) ATPase subunit
MRRNKSSKIALREDLEEKQLQDAWLSIRVNREEREAFKRWCQNNGTTAAQEFKKMMRNLMSTGQQ